jgi:hypothetical protein
MLLDVLLIISMSKMRERRQQFAKRGGALQFKILSRLRGVLDVTAALELCTNDGQADPQNCGGVQALLVNIDKSSSITWKQTFGGLASRIMLAMPL